MTTPTIIGIVLIQNEDLFIDRVLTNIIGFCDEIIVADNFSTDQTSDKVKDLQQQQSKIRYHSIRNPSLSHDLISGYAGEKTWIFAVDGDEVYDPVGLQKLRTRIIAGEYDSQWMILGNALNCIEFNPKKGYARGYLAPPCRSMTKLYNFRAIEAWAGPCPERLHGGDVCFRRGYDKSLRLELHKDVTWNESDFRCLHLCFIRRSSLEKDNTGRVIRKNISDMLSEGICARIKTRCFNLMGITQKSSWKREKYMRGKLVEKNIEPFVG